MAGLNDYPIYLNGTALPFFPTSWQRTPQNIRNKNQSEGGRDIIQNIRSDKMSISASFALADYTWVQFFEDLNMLDSFVLKEYDPRTNAYKERTVYMEGLSDGSRRKSNELTAITGIWDVSFTLEEF